MLIAYFELNRNGVFVKMGIGCILLKPITAIIVIVFDERDRMYEN